MEASIVENDGKKMVIHFNGMDMTVPELLASKLSGMEGIEFAAARQPHPERPDIELIVIAEKKNVKTIFSNALNELVESMDELKGKLKK